VSFTARTPRARIRSRRRSWSGPNTPWQGTGSVSQPA